MIFEQEVNIYSSEAIVKRFRAVDTSFQVVQGKVSALISESELIELENSEYVTMYSKLASAFLDINGLNLSFSDLTTKYDSVAGQYNELSSRVAEYKIGLDGLSANVTSISNRVDSAETWINSASLKITDSAIVSTVTSSFAWGSKADKNSLISQINQSAEQIAIQASKIKLEGLVTANSYFKILTDGSIEATSGKIGAWDLTSYALQSTDRDVGIRFSGNTAFWAGGNSFVVYRDGHIDINNDLDIFGVGNINFLDDDDDTPQMAKISGRGGELLEINVSGGKAIGFTCYNQYAYIINNGLNPGATEKHLFYGAAKFFGGIRSASYYVGSHDARITERVWNGSVYGVGISNNLYVTGNISCGGRKNRVVDTANYGTILLSAYETTEPMFGDMGHAVINEFGICVIPMESKFIETVSTEYGYYVFLTKYADGDIHVSRKELSNFTVKGTPGTEFDWEVKAHQKGYETDRLNSSDTNALITME